MSSETRALMVCQRGWQEFGLELRDGWGWWRGGGCACEGRALVGWGLSAGVDGRGWAWVVSAVRGSSGGGAQAQTAPGPGVQTPWTHGHLRHRRPGVRALRAGPADGFAARRVRQTRQIRQAWLTQQVRQIRQVRLTQQATAGQTDRQARAATPSPTRRPGRRGPASLRHRSPRRASRRTLNTRTPSRPHALTPSRNSRQATRGHDSRPLSRS